MGEVLTVLRELQAELSTTARPIHLLYADLLRSAVEGESRGIEMGCHLMPLGGIGLGGVHENFLELLEWMPLHSDDDFKAYIQRLMNFTGQVEDFCGLLAYGCGMK